jgi:hypothetical protein
MWFVKEIGGNIGRIALIMTFFGIFISVCDEYFSQYDNDPCKIFKSSHTKNVDISEIIDKDEAAAAANIFFVLDVSKSMEQKISITAGVQEQLGKQIEGINNFGVGIVINKDKDFTISKLLCVHLCTALIKMQGSNYNLNIIQFAETPEYLTKDAKNDFSENGVRKALECVKNVKFDGKNTDFVTLFHFFEKKITDDYNHFARTKNTLVFLSDFIHEPKDEHNKNIESIKEVINRLSQNDIHFNIIISRNGIEKPQEFKSIEKLIQNEIPNNRYKIINALDEINIKLEFSSQSSKTHFPFFYTNHLYENNLVTTMSFSGTKNKNYSFSLEGHNEQQIYKMVCDGDTMRLTKYPTTVSIKLQDTIHFIMTGYISHHSPPLFLRIEDDSSIHEVGIIFYKRFPGSGKIILSIMGGMIIGMIIGLLRMKYGKKAENNSPDNPENETQVRL